MNTWYFSWSTTGGFYVKVHEKTQDDAAACLSRTQYNNWKYIYSEAEWNKSQLMYKPILLEVFPK